MARNIELVVRSQMSVPAEWTVVPESPKAGSIPGYDDIDIRFGSQSGGDHQQLVRFLLSKDRQQLARLSTFTLTKIPGVDINTGRRPVYGMQNAPVEIIDFDDLQCPFCARMDLTLTSDIMARYKGFVKIVRKDFPLIGVHPWAMHAAVNANCLAAQSADAYWSYVEKVHAQSAEITGNNRSLDFSLHALDTLAKQKGNGSSVDMATLNVCIAKQDQSEIVDSMAEGKALRVTQTPTLFIGGERLTGLTSERALRATIDRALIVKGLVPPQ